MEVMEDVFSLAGDFKLINKTTFYMTITIITVHFTLLFINNQVYFH